MIALNRLSRGKNAGLRLLKLQDSFLENHARSIGAQRFIESSSRLGDLPKPLLIQFALHRLPPQIPNKVAPTVFRAQRNQRAFPGTDSDRENTHTELGGPFRGRNSIRSQLFAIRQNDEGAGLSLSFAEGLRGDANGFRDVRSSLGDDRGIELLERGQHRVVVER